LVDVFASQQMNATDEKEGRGGLQQLQTTVNDDKHATNSPPPVTTRPNAGANEGEWTGDDDNSKHGEPTLLLLTKACIGYTTTAMTMNTSPMLSSGMGFQEPPITPIKTIVWVHTNNSHLSLMYYKAY
jgi:hypothetical protein